MLKITRKLMVVATFCMCILGCRNGIDTDSVTYIGEKDSKSIATDYVKKIFSLNNVAASRSAEGNEYPEFLYELQIEDAQGNPIYFKNMPDEEKEAFSKYWTEQTIENISKKLEGDPELAEMVFLENEAFYTTLGSSSGSRAAAGLDYEKFGELYGKNLSNILKREYGTQEARAASAGVADITSDCLVPNSISAFRNNYKKGRILICQDSNSSSASSYIGHASIMCKDYWDSKFDRDGFEKTTMTSSPKDMSAQWPGKIDGVQYEPIGYWAGNAPGSAGSVKILEAQGQRWVWDWFRSGFRPYATSDEQGSMAANYAMAQEGKPYIIPLIPTAVKWREDTFYCSQLVWRAWYNVSSDFDVSLGFLFTWVSPADIVVSDKTREVCSIRNK
ncbi:MAG: hypothetical protein IKP60_02640 [Treponema sp.]|nr:hypothetical protein [Treponema sp.]